MERNLLFFFVLLCTTGHFLRGGGGGGYIWRGDLTEGFFALRVWGALYLEGLIHGGAYFRNFTVKRKTPTGLRNGTAEYFKNF